MSLITLDFETYYDKDYSLSKMTTEAYVRDEQFEVIGVAVQVDDGAPQWFSGTMEQTKVWLNQFAWDDAALLCHNTAFDGAILAWRFDITPKFYLDTLSMARPLHAITVGGSLHALTEHYGLGKKGTEVVMALGKRRLDFSPDELAAYAGYCRNDVALTHKLYEKLRPQIPESELVVIDLMLRMYTHPVLQIDRSMLEKHLSDIRTGKADKLKHAIKTAAAGSPDVLAEVVAARANGKKLTDLLMSNNLFAELLRTAGITPPTKTSLRTGKETWAFGKTDKEFTDLLDHEDATVQALVAARLGVKSTLEETRTLSMIGVSERGPLPILLNYYGAHTGRASGGDKMNLQNLPRGGTLRASLKAPDGHLLVACDSSQIEARMVGWQSGQDDLTAAFAAGEDIYSLFATDIYGYPVSKAEETKKERHVGKTAILGLGYGMSANKFRDTVRQAKITLDQTEAERVVNLYRRKYDRIPALWDAHKQMLNNMLAGGSGEVGVGITLKYTPDAVVLPNGMMLRYPDLRSEGREITYAVKRGRSVERVRIYGGKAVENAIQALARIVVFDQMAKAHQLCQQLRSRFGGLWQLVLTVHDEIVAVVPEEHAEKFGKFLERIMSTPPSWAPDLPVACEYAIGKSYADCK